MEKIIEKLELGEMHGPITSEQIWAIYYQVVRELARELATDVSQVVEFQALDEMEFMGCMSCPLYQHQVIKIQGR